MKRVLALVLILAAALVAGIVATLPARAASPGSGFGEWASSTSYGWHGSMMVNGIHTYCIFPGRPLPTGASEDHGVSTSAADLDPQRLTAINMLVSTYGQTADPVQAAAVGWAVKAIANWNETLHHFGYPGDSLQGAIDWVFRHIAPEHNLAVQNLAAAYYAEAMALPTGAMAASGSLQFTIDENDALRGTMTAVADVPSARGTVTLENATFADTGSSTREGIDLNVAYAIVAAPPAGQPTFQVRGSGTFRSGFVPAVHHFVTPGGQDTAGPVGPLDFALEGADQATRDATFAPVITTQVVTRYTPGAAYVDDVTFASARGGWGRTADGGYVPVTATATVYRTDEEPAETAEPPADAEPVLTLQVTTDPALGPTAPYRVESEEELPGPGFYTAVWEIVAAGQPTETTAALEPDYAWRETFGEQSQIMMISAISSRADPVVAVGAEMGDEVIVDGVVPRGGLRISAAVYRVPDGVDPTLACTPQNQVWAGPSTPPVVTEPGSVRVDGAPVPDFGTYVWRERAVDAADRLVHEGACGVESETTRAPLPTVTTTALDSVGRGGEATDVAHIDGPIPVTGTTTLTFEIFRAPDGVAPADACTPETRVAETSATPVVVTASGDHPSPGVRLHDPGTHYWIETLWHTPEGGEPRELARGTCGLPNETTIVETPTVTTTAMERASTGDPYSDLATVTGLGDGVDAELVFSVFHNEHGQTPTCSPETLEHTTVPVAVTASGEFRSPTVQSERPGVKLWIAELRYRPTPDADRVILHTGGCGEPGETTYVDALAASGGHGPRLIAGAGLGAIGAGLGVWAILVLRSRRRIA